MIRCVNSALFSLWQTAWLSSGIEDLKISSCLQEMRARHSPESGGKMRLDKYLKVSRLIKRRTVANEACDAGKISVNGKITRASYDVKEGDIIEIILGARVIKVKVTAVKEVVRKEEAETMYQAVLD